jgi:hypothetical protein
MISIIDSERMTIKKSLELGTADRDRSSEWRIGNGGWKEDRALARRLRKLVPEEHCVGGRHRLSDTTRAWIVPGYAASAPSRVGQTTPEHLRCNRCWQKLVGGRAGA